MDTFETSQLQQNNPIVYSGEAFAVGENRLPEQIKVYRINGDYIAFFKGEQYLVFPGKNSDASNNRYNYYINYDSKKYWFNI